MRLQRRTNLALDGHRVGLDGEACGEVTDEERTHAKDRLKAG